MPSHPYAWLGDVGTFLATPEAEILSDLTAFARETGAPQLFAWDRSITSLRRELGACMPDASAFALVLEFELPRSGGRRPDLILLENGTVLVIEFKNRVAAEPADLDQVLGYVKDLADYHAGCRERKLVPILVPIGMEGAAYEDRGVQVAGPAGLGALIRQLAKGHARSKPDAESWVKAPYEPLPALVEAARLLFENQPLPRIRRAESAEIPRTVELIESKAKESVAAGGKSLILLTGVPGSGKTLVGLQLVHSRHLSAPSVFLSGNGPLVQVLKYSLKSQEFVCDLHAFLREHVVRRPGPPRERVIVFDEAQRAWDRDRILLKHQGRMTGSEPDLLVRLCDSHGEGCALVALMGEGQEIHAGEEAGIGQWVEAVRGSSGWQVTGPPHLKKAFLDAGLDYEEQGLLNLSKTLRSHRAESVALWSGLLLEGKLDLAASVAEELRSAGFCLWASRSLETCRSYVRDRYAGEGSKRYGIIASSKYRKLEEEHGIRTPRTPYYYYGQWFEAPPSDPHSCCRLEIAVTEFGCQGLELDLPLLCWGPDLTWDGSAWVGRFRKSQQIRDPQRLRINAYRVLLTRGRDGLVVFVPPGLDSTWEALRKAGFEAL